MTGRALEFRAYPVSASLVSGPVFVGPCILDGVFTMTGGIPTFTLFDSLGPSGTPIFFGDSNAVAFDSLGIRLTVGLFLVQSALPSKWTFVLADARGLL